METIIKHKFFVLSVALFLLSLLFMPVSSNFAVNDDGIFVRQLEHDKISSLVDPAFITQKVLGNIWGNIFGVSFSSMRALTIVVFIFFLCGVYKILCLYNVKDGIKVFVLLTIIFNPIIYNSTLSFMTEIYYLCFFTWGIYFYLKDLRKDDIKYFMVGTLFGVLAFLVRQYGIILFAIYFVIRIFYKKICIKRLIYTVIFFSIGIGIYMIWPRYGEGNFISNVATLSVILENIKKLVYTLPYFTYFLLPIIFLIKSKYKVILILISIPLCILLFNLDIFALGSVFYVEELHVKSDFSHILSIGDNIFFKIGLSFLLSYSFLKLVMRVKIKFRDSEGLFLVLLFLSSLLSLVIATDFYDRYLLPALIPLVIMLVANFDMNKLGIVVLTLFCLFNLSLNVDYFNKTALSWEIGEKIQNDRNLVTQVYVDDVFGKYYSAKKSGDYTGLVNLDSGYRDAVCFVQKYVVSDDTVFSKLEALGEKYMDNPRVFASKKKNMSRITNNLDKLLYNKEYFSPIYNIIGSSAYVGGYCVEKN